MDRQEEILAALKDIQKTLNFFGYIIGFMGVSILMIGSHLKIYWWQ